MTLSPQHVFSPSQIISHEQCPFCWECNLEHQPQILTETKYADAGTVIHQSIAEYFRTINPNPTKGEIEGTFQTILDRNWQASGLKQMEPRKDKCFESFTRFEVKRKKSWLQYIPSMIEQNLTTTINGINYRTIVDAYWEKDATIVDWKSGRLNQLGIMERIQGQVMKMIITAQRKPVLRVLFVSLLVGAELPMPETTDGFVEVKVRSMFERFRTNHFPKKKGYHCDYCGYTLRCKLGDRCIWM